MKFLLSTGSLYTYSLVRCFAFAKAAGFDGIELMADQRWDTRQTSYLQALMAHFELSIDAVHCPFDPVPGWPADKVELIRHTVALAEELGARVVVQHLPLRFGLAQLSVDGKLYKLPVPRYRVDRIYYEWLVGGGYTDFQAQTPIRVCIENMPAVRILKKRWNAHHWNTIEGMRRFTWMTMDTTHLGTWGLEPADIYPQWRQSVAHIHLSNFDGREHRRPEAGHLDLKQFLALVSAEGYVGAVSIEVSPDALNAGTEDDALIGLLAHSLRLCRGWAQDEARSS